MGIVKANEVLRHAYKPPPKGTFDNKEVDNLVGEPCERMSLKKAAKARLTAAVTAKASAQVEDDVIDEEEGEIDKQYAAIEIDYEAEAISE